MVGILPVWTGKGMFLTQTNLFGYRAGKYGCFRMLYNKVEKRQEWLDCAIQGGEFLKKYGIDIGDTEKLKELSYHCFLCGKCTEVCPIGIDGRDYILKAFAGKMSGRQ